MSKNSKRKDAELRRLIREQEKDMRNSHTVIQYKGRSKECQPNYKPGDDKELATALENFIQRNKDVGVNK